MTNPHQFVNGNDGAMFAAASRDRLQQIVEQGMRRAAPVIQRVLDEVPTDTRVGRRDRKLWPL